MLNVQTPDNISIARHVLEGVQGDVRSVSIIGSYLMSHNIRPGSDIDLVVVVRDLGSSALRFGSVIYKDNEINDPMGLRKEQNTSFKGVPLDVTLIDRFNTPSNPLTDNYENALGSFMGSLAIFGESLSDIFEIPRLMQEYDSIKEQRLTVILNKIDRTIAKIIEQDRLDFAIINELYRYIFLRECIQRSVFPQYGIKHPDTSVQGFNKLFIDELSDHGIMLDLSWSNRADTNG